MQLIAELQALLPKAIQWAQDHNEIIQKNGIPLNDEQIDIAKHVGVKNPEEVRILHVEKIPLPDKPKLKEAAKQIGFLTDEMKGLTLGHSIYIVEDHYSRRLISHELRHVYHYEVFGSIPEFLVEYLKQIVLVGYERSVLEQDARIHEVD